MNDKSDKLLTDKELNEAWENAFEREVYIDHEPTFEDVFIIRLRAVAQAQLDKITGLLRGLE